MTWKDLLISKKTTLPSVKTTPSTVETTDSAVPTTTSTTHAIPPPPAAAAAAAAAPPSPTKVPAAKRSPSPKRASQSSGIYDSLKLPLSPRSTTTTTTTTTATTATKANENKSSPSTQTNNNNNKNNKNDNNTNNANASSLSGVLTKNDQNKPPHKKELLYMETWVPPSSPPRHYKFGSGSNWSFKEKSDPTDQPIATSPVKEGRANRFSFNTTTNGDNDDESRTNNNNNNNTTSIKNLLLQRNNLRIQFSTDFIAGIKRIEEERNNDLSLRYIRTNQQPDSQKRGKVRVFVRKRPLFPKDKKEGNYDVVRMEEEKVVVYNTFVESDMKTQTIKPAVFGVNACFDETNDKGSGIYQKCAKSLVETAQSGGIATIVMFGKNGTGKTYTLSAMEGVAARDIFTGLPYNYMVKVTLVELFGQRCRDLMDDGCSPVRIVDNKNDASVRFVNALSIDVATPEDLLEAIVNGKRRSQKQGIDASGFCRHIVCRIVVVPPKDAPECIRSGTLTLVDCGSTERPTEQQSVQVEIDASIWALKECIRAKTTLSYGDGGTHKIPYGNSTLTRILRESLEREDATFHVLATVSAKATDTERTLETLSSVSQLIAGYSEENVTGQPSSLASEAETPTPPKSWDYRKLCNWLTRKHLVKDVGLVPNDMTGRKIMQMTKAELNDTFFREENDIKKADLLYRCLRAETDRVARLELKRRMALTLNQSLPIR